VQKVIDGHHNMPASFYAWIRNSLTREGSSHTGLQIVICLTPFPISTSLQSC